MSMLGIRKVGQQVVTKQGINKAAKNAKKVMRYNLINTTCCAVSSGALFATGSTKAGVFAAFATLIGGLGTALAKFTKNAATKNMVSTRGVTYNDIVKRAKQIYSK